MLTIAKLAGGSEGYYLSAVASGVEDYYVGSGEAPGYWAGASGFHGLTGEVEGVDLRAVLGGVLPGRGRLPGLRASRRVPGFDATVAAPKSVSLLYALADPGVSEQVRQAHDVAVAAALDYLEAHAAFVRRGAQGVEHVQAEGLLAAAFRHRTSRNLDPHLHTHVLIANQGQAVDDGLWRTLDARRLYEAQTTAGYLYQAVLRWELTTRLGVAWEPVVNGHADLAGMPRWLIEAFSTRTADLKQHLAILRGEAGDGEVREDWTAREAELAAYKTRQAKQRLADGAPLRQRWREKAEALGWRPAHFARLLGRVTAQVPSAERLGEVAAELAGPDGLTADRSTFNLGDVVRAWAARLPEGAPAETIVALDRQALADLRTGDPAPLLAAYHQHDRLTIRDTDALTRDRMAADWAARASAHPDKLADGIMLAARRTDADELNHAARARLRAARLLGADTLTAGGRGYAVGDRIVCLRNNKRLEVTNGTRGHVTATDPATGQLTITVDGPNRARW